MEDLFKIMSDDMIIAVLNKSVSTANAIKIASILSGELHVFDHMSDSYQKVWPFIPGVEMSTEWQEAQVLAKIN